MFHIDRDLCREHRCFYCFSPFNCVLRVVTHEHARGILVVPYWPTKLGYPLLLPILECPPITLRHSFHLPHTSFEGINSSTDLLLCLLSGQQCQAIFTLSMNMSIDNEKITLTIFLLNLNILK